MPKVKYQYNDKESFEVYGARIYKEKCREYDDEWTETRTELLIYNGDWSWVDAKYYEPIEE